MRPDWRLFVLGALFIVFLVVGYFSDRAVMQAVSELHYLAKGVEAAIDMDNWFMASELLNKLSTSWPTTRRVWDLRMDRDEMDEFDLCLARLQSHASQKDKSGALSELAMWQVLITHVQQKEIFRWRNLL